MSVTVPNMKVRRGFTKDEIREAEEFQTQNLPIWREAFLGIDWLSLQMSSVYQGIGVPTGDGSGVVLVPGFMGSDRYLRDMRGWLGKISYTPYLSGIGRNFDCPNILSERLINTIERAEEETGGPVHIIGHSLGGVIGRSVAARLPQLVTSVITLASPFRGVRAHPLAVVAAGVARGRVAARRGEEEKPPDCFTGKCSCEFVEALKGALPRPVMDTAIYTKTDGVVDWQRCITGDPDTDIEVSGTHIGLAFNPTVYKHIAERLAIAVDLSS